MPLDPASCLTWTTRLTGIGAVLMAAECLWQAGAFRPGGLLDWQVCQHHRRYASFPVGLRRLLDPALDWPGCLFVLGLYGVSGLVLCVRPEAGLLRQWALLALVAASFLWEFRSVSLATYGADHLRTIVALALLVQSFAPASRLVGAAALLFLAAVAAFIYLGSGLLKRRQSKWRNGTALVQVLRLEVMGCPPVGQWVSRFPLAARLATWGVMLYQICFPFALVHPAAALGFITGGVLMHLGIGVLMGVNRFIWTMGSFYPAVWYAAQCFGPP